MDVAVTEERGPIVTPFGTLTQFKKTSSRRSRAFLLSRRCPGTSHAAARDRAHDAA